MLTWETARHGGASRRVVEWLASLHTCAGRYRRAAFEGEGCWCATNVGANGPAVPGLLECDLRTAKILFRQRGKPIDSVVAVTLMM